MEVKLASLHMLFEGASVGLLTYDPTADDFHFEYSKEWIDRGGFLISPHIRPDQPLAKGVVTRFLENLLPEGEGLRDLARLLRVNTSNVYSLIIAIGTETTGALTISPHIEPPEPRYRPVTRDELSERIRERKRRSITIWDEKPRLSVAGVQNKLPIIERQGEFAFGEGRYCSTNILKFGNDRTEHLVLNEYFCMKLAHAAGMNVASCSLIQLNERVLNVTRFDRAWKGSDLVERFHIIDGCQALDLAPRMKYERFLGDEVHVRDITGPATLENIYRFCEKTITPAKTRLDLLQWVIFNLLIGNCDCHMKNVSFHVNDDGMMLSPFYDLVSVTMYEGLEQSLAFHVGDTFTLDEVNAYQLAEMAAELKLSKTFVANQIQKVVQSVLDGLARIERPEMSAAEADFIARLRREIGARCERFSNEARAIPKFTSVT